VPRIRRLLMATGCLSRPSAGRSTAVKDFRGKVLFHRPWPIKAIDLAGQRFRGVGTGRQVNPVRAHDRRAGSHLTVPSALPEFWPSRHNGPTPPIAAAL